MNRRASLLVFSLLAFAGLASVASGVSGADWPQFRGINRDGVSREAGLLKSWPDDGPKVLWKVPIGDGYSAISVAGGRLYTMYNDGADEIVAAHDPATGKRIWRFRSDSAYSDSMGSGPRATPVVDGGLVYTMGARGQLNALDAKTGKRVWGVDITREYGAKSPQWGISTTPLVEGNLLLVDVGGSSGKSAVALDKKTGKLVWAAQSDKAGYSAPIAITVGGVRQVIFFTATSVASLSPKDGRLFWRTPWRTDWDVNAATPLFVPPDKLFVSSGYDTGSALFQIKAGGGRAGIEEVWRNRGMKNQFSSSVLHNGTIYGFDNATLKAINAATGEDRWRQRGFGHGSLILADGHLYVLSDRGKLALVEVSPEEYREKGSFDPLSGKCWTAPVLANGVLYIRNEQEMMALDVRGPAAKPTANQTAKPVAKPAAAKTGR